ncbi:MAG: OmpA family protein [Defluviitaleaceae bacterium]|nr:OmpA family protein [Defluviitaleaceae bacterium]
MFRRGHDQEKPENHERWMITYADFITLLMVFFIIMYAMSQVDATKFQELAQSLNIALTGGTGILDQNNGVIGPGGQPNTPGPDATPTPTPYPSYNPTGTDAEIQGMENLERQLKDYLAEQNISNDVSISIDERGLVISVNAAILFALGSADINQGAEAEIAQIGAALKELDNYIRVEGHTDNTPIRTARFYSNWELSAARATNVLRLLMDRSGIPPERLSAVGYGEYRPLADNSTAEGRAKNRRVDIILLSSKYNGLEAGA